MSVLLAICIIGSSVFAKLPTGQSPMLHQATIAAPASTPSATDLSTMPTLAGITLDEDPTIAFRRLNLEPPDAHAKGPSAFMRTYSLSRGNIVVTILFLKKIISIDVLGEFDRTPDFTDPFGVRIGDSLDKVERIRGKPSFVGSDINVQASAPSIFEARYGSLHGIVWTYTIMAGQVRGITLADNSQ